MKDYAGGSAQQGSGSSAFQMGHAATNSSDQLAMRNDYLRMYGGPKHLSKNATKANQEMRDAFIKHYAGAWGQYIQTQNQQDSSTNNLIQQSQTNNEQSQVAASATAAAQAEKDGSSKNAAASHNEAKHDLSSLPQWWTSAPSESSAASLLEDASAVLAAGAGAQQASGEEANLRGSSNLESKPESKSLVPLFATVAFIASMVAAFKGRSYLRGLGTRPEMEQYFFLQA